MKRKESPVKSPLPCIFRCYLSLNNMATVWPQATRCIFLEEQDAPNCIICLHVGDDRKYARRRELMAAIEY
jgi:hypothetical protein